MMPDKHILFGIVIALLFILFEVPLVCIILVVLTSILIDIDHLFYYVFKFKRFNLYEMYKYFTSDAHFENSTTMLPILIFHNIETCVILIITSIFFPLMSCVFLGFVFHMILDWIAMPRQRYPLIIKLSLIITIFENNRRKRGCPRW